LLIELNEKERSIMRIKLLSAAAILAAAVLAGCDAKPVTNASAGNANASNANVNAAAKPAAPTKEALVAIEKKAWEQWAARDEKGLDGYLASKFISAGPYGASDRAETLKSWTGHKCEMKELIFSDENVTELGEGLALLTFKAKSDIKCDGKTGPDPVNVSVLYVKEGEAWKAMYYQEVPSADSKGEYGPPTTPIDKTKELASLTAASDDLVSIEKKLWDTWKSQDRKAFEELVSAKFVGNGRGGFIGRDAFVKGAFDPPCKIESVGPGPMRSMDINKDLTMIVYRATQKGTCGTDKLPENVMAVSIFARENGKPMSIYYMENPVK
jgi:hypothetical protein